MQDAFDPTTIIFAALAIFVLFKLRSILGTRTGEERPPFNPFERPAPPAAPEGGDNVIRLPGAAQYDEPQTPQQRWGKFADAAAIDGLEEIAAADAQFSGPGFVGGARSAYEMIVLAFAHGDKDALKDLLAHDVFDSFANAINTRVARGEKVDTTFVSIDAAQIADAHLRGRTAQITMRFTSKIITVTRNADGDVVDGNSDRIVEVVDVWTFARETGTSDPNWKLVATEAAH